MHTGLRTTGGGRSRGVALAIVIIFGFVLAVLATVVLVFFQSNVSSYSFVKNRLKARIAAEAGAMLALHILEQDYDSAPQSGTPFHLPGDSAQWVRLPESEDLAWVVVDPCNRNREDNLGAVEIRSRGMAGGMSRDVVMRACPDYASRYALMVDGDVLDFFEDGRVVDGPVHANGRIEFSSLTPDSTNDPRVHAVSTTADGGFYLEGMGRIERPHPPGSNLWVRPYSHHVLGRPYWNDAVPEADFDRMVEYYRRLEHNAAVDGTQITGGGRLLLDGDIALFKGGPAEPADTIPIAELDVLFVRNGSSPLYVKTLSEPSEPLSIVSNGSIYIAGLIETSSVSVGGPLALIAMRDVRVARDPEAYGQPDWPNPWNIDTDRGLLVKAVVAALGGSLEAEDPSHPNPSGRLSLVGGLIQRRFGILGIAGHGYELSISYDQVLASTRPPFFPSLGRWHMLSWEQDPDYGGRDIEQDMY
ncbi:hypothetical protein GF402_02485 [Candidatus Fermentibacteria bacterium]|nr:hypothetical protein [Candidatus Fermentibacteria bacterium]